MFAQDDQIQEHVDNVQKVIHRRCYDVAIVIALQNGIRVIDHVQGKEEETGSGGRLGRDRVCTQEMRKNLKNDQHHQCGEQKQPEPESESDAHGDQRSPAQKHSGKDTERPDHARTDNLGIRLVFDYGQQVSR